MHELAARSDNETAVVPAEHTPSLTELSLDTGLSRASVAAHLKKLEALGWVKRTQPSLEAALRDGARTEYALAIGRSPGAGLVQDVDYARSPAGGLVQELDHVRSPGAGPHVVQELDSRSPGAGHKKSTTKNSPKTTGAATRGTRIPDDFAITPEMVAWARTDCPDVDGKVETAAFIDWATSAPGSKGVKRNWVAAWRNWLRREQKRHSERKDRLKPPTVPTVADERCPRHPHELAGYCRRCPEGS